MSESLRSDGVQIGEFWVSGFPSIQCAADQLLERAKDGRSLAIVALNAEKLARNTKMQSHLADLSGIAVFYPDGMPVAWLMRRRGCKTTRIPGVDLWEKLMLGAAERKLKVYLLGGAPPVSERTQKLLKMRIPLLDVRVRHGHFDSENLSVASVIKEIRSLAPSIVCVGLGSPKQEMFIRDCVAAHPDCLYMGVGGTFDVYSGEKRRAPLFMRRLGLEFAYRMFAEPTRIIRYRSLLIFLWYFARGKY